MSEKLKVFTNVQNSTQTDSSTLNIITTAVDEQAVIKDVIANINVSLGYEVTFEMSNENFSIFKKEKIIGDKTVKLNGYHLVDTESSVDLGITLTQIGTPKYLSNTRAMFFGNNTDNVVDIDNTERISNIQYDNTLEYNIIVSSMGSIASQANSAFTVNISGQTYFCRGENNYIGRHDFDGTLIHTSPAFSSNTYGFCTDETYYYGKKEAKDTIIQRYDIATNAFVSDLTTGISFKGQSNNQGAYLLIYGDYIYSKEDGSSQLVYKIHKTTGVTTTITIASGTSYSVGARITESIEGIPYLVEMCNGIVVVINLNTLEVMKQTVSFTSYTEYGNAAMELSSGVIAFFHNTKVIEVDVNNESIDTSDIVSNSVYGIKSSLGAYTSIAQKPIYKHTMAEVTPAYTYDVNVSGVDIKGVI